jgi:uncharacterized protein YlzI (FlbEa/FlbD family)
MLMRLSKLTGDDSDKRTYFNTRMIATVRSVVGDPDSTLILMFDRSKALIKKPVEEVIRKLKEYDVRLVL